MTDLQEAALLLRQGLTPGQTCATRAIGYRQAMEALQHWQADPPTATPAALVRRDTSCADYRLHNTRVRVAPPAGSNTCYLGKCMW